MGTKTVDETGAETGTEGQTTEKKVDIVKAAETTEAADSAEAAEAAEYDEVAEDGDAEDWDEVTAEASDDSPSAIAQGAGAVVSAALGLVSLNGGWIGTVASARESLVGQLETSSDASVAKQIKEVYGDAWQASALWGGVFALFALIVGVVVLARPAFGTPGSPQPTWVKSVAWGGVALGVIGLLLAVLKYTDALLGLPSAS